MHMGNRVIRISDAEAARDFASLLERMRADDEVVIEHDAQPVAVVRLVSSAPSSTAQAFAEISQTVPDEDWERVPTDLSKNLDHYLYGSDAL